MATVWRMQNGDSSTNWVALLRGVNVGGVAVEMAALRGLAEGLGWGEVKSYIASGNLVFRAAGPAEGLRAALEAALAGRYGRAIPVLILSGEGFRAALAAHPFQPERGNQSHVFFCWDAPVLDQALFQALRAPDEDLRVTGGHVHFHAPGGIGRSKLAERLGKVVTGTEITGRNLNTVRKLAEMLDAGGQTG
ncbi:DUF1697 domain-containing protein [Maritimibacter fusiformis]|nr:DUF1697 domain-containing protein [Maritimibacter fusiformis]